VSDETSPIVVTLKGGTGYDQPWIVVRGNTPDQVAAMLRNLGELPAATLEASNLLQNVATLAPVLPNSAQPAPPAQAPQQNVTPGPWPNTPQQQAPQAPVQPAPQQQGQQGQYGETLHPENKGCQMCGQVLVRKQTSTGKATWRCPQWRWNNGQQNGHTQEWING
jgi:hypothetical protein